MPTTATLKIGSSNPSPTELAPVLPHIKRPIVDVRCCDTMGRSFIVEMQIEWIEGFMQRMLFNTGNSYVLQLQRGKPYPLLKPVYALAILATSFSEGEEWYHHYRMAHVNEPDNTIEGIELIFVELPKYQIKTAEDRLLRRLWVRFLQLNGGYQKQPEELSQSPEISHALTLLEENAYTPAELLAYEEYWDAIRVNTTIQESYFKKGEEQGKQKGLEQGLEQGRVSERKKTIQKMLLAGFSFANIASLLELSPEEMEQYAEEGGITQD
jgi:predicted transposase/invertase (TIGR01784 family)